MINKTKALLIPIAAFAVTVTGASAFNSSVLENAGLNGVQISAFEEARELREEGDKEGAREVLVVAGIDMETMHAVRDAMKEHRARMHDDVDAAIQNGDYDAFLVAVAGSPIGEIVDTPEEFSLFTEAFNLREAGDKEAAREIMEELGFEGKMHKRGHGMKDDFNGRHENRMNGFRGGDSE